MTRLDDLEAARLTQQVWLDSKKSQRERNQWGQFATPPDLARELATQALSYLAPGEPIRFLDPAIGTGSLYSALLAAAGEARVVTARGFEIDAHYGEPARHLWRDTALRLDLTDFTQAAAPAETPGVNLVIANPPYVRHHHLDTTAKARLQQRSRVCAGMNLSGLAGLYAHFIAITHAWMAPDGLACWLIPSEFMDVNYGREVKRYLLERVTLMHIHRFDPTDAQFDDALVSSAVVWFRNTPPPADHAVRFTFGGTHARPAVSRTIDASTLLQAPKWTRFPVQEIQPVDHVTPRLKDLFDIRRGIATGDNQFFILPAERVEALGLPRDQLTPILPSPRYLTQDIIEADSDGLPLLDRRLFLVDCRLPADEVRRRYPTLWAYLESGREAVMQRYLCAHRTLWYRQEDRPPAPFLCTYMGRTDRQSSSAFRFIRNKSRAVVANTYLNLYPKPHVAQRLHHDARLADQVWQLLNALDPAAMVAEGRVYGGGLHKMEPKELAQVPVPTLARLLGQARKDALDFSPTVEA